MNLLVLNLAVDANHVTLAFALRWIEELARRYDHVDVVTMSVGPHRLPPNVTVWSLGGERGLSKPRRFLRFYMTLFRILRRRRIGVAFAHMNPIFAAMFAPVGKLIGVRTVLWYAHGAVPFALKIAESVVDACVTSTQEGFRLPSRKLSIIGQGVEPEVWMQETTRSSAEVFRIVSVCRLGPSKGVDLLLESVAALVDVLPMRVQLDIVGDATNDAEAAHAASLRAIAAKLGVGAVFHGRRSPAEVAQLLARADAFVAMSSTGSLDKAIVEAMMSGTVVVSCNDAFAAIARRIDREICVVTRDVASLSGRLELLARLTPSERAAIGVSLRAAALADHTLPALMDRLTGILRTHADGVSVDGTSR